MPQRKCGIAVRQQPKGKHTQKIKVALKTSKKNNMQANKPYISTGLRHIFAIVSSLILLHEKSLQFDCLIRAVLFQLNLKYLHVKITNLLRVVV